MTLVDLQDMLLVICLVLQVHFNVPPVSKVLYTYSLLFPVASIASLPSNNMASRGIPIYVLSAIFVAFLSTQFNIPNTWSLNHLAQQLGFISFPSSSHLPQSCTHSFSKSHHRRHHDPDDGKGRSTSICDNFPPNIPPPDSNTTSYLCVDRNGCCNFTTVQSAVDAVGLFSPKRTIIWVNTGIYFEKVTIPRTKPNITFQGQGLESTAIVWNDTANSSGGTFFSASVSIFSDNFVAKNISFMNVAPMPKPGDVGAQAVAIRVNGDQAAFWGCGFFGAQDTLHDDKGRHYFRDCFIQGSIDFIFGNGRSLYQNCRMSSIANPLPPGVKSINGAVTAHGRASKDDNTGFVFLNCTIGGTGRIWLGRAWRPFSRVIFANTFMSDIISPDGWNDFNDPTRDQTVFYGEYKCSGGGANATMRVPFGLQLNDTQAAPFITNSYIDADQWLQPFLSLT